MKEYRILYDLAEASWKKDNNALNNIIISPGHVVQTILDVERQKFVALKAVSVNINNYPSLPDILNPDFIKIPARIFLSVPKTMLIPSVLFEREMNYQFLAQHQK